MAGHSGAAARLLLAIAAVLGGLILMGGRTAHAQGITCGGTGGGPPYRFHAYEAPRDRAPYLLAQQLAGRNLLFPTDPTLALQPLLSGAPAQRTPLEGAGIPSQLLHAIGWIESALTQAAAPVPFETVGDTLVSFDCGYGIMQVTSFFTNAGDIPSRAEALVGTHFAANVAMGAQILADKWNSDVFPVVDQSDPRFVESWYYATWEYNGFVSLNHPAGADVDPFRASPFACEGPRNGYPYQELVFGCVVNPPVVSGAPLWQPLPVKLPNLAVLAAPVGPLDIQQFFAGWSLILTAPFSGDDASQPFASMTLPLPTGSLPLSAQAFLNGDGAIERLQLLGQPVLVVDQTRLDLTVTDDTVDEGRITIRNTGTGLLSYRLVPDEDWIQVSLDAGIAAGGDVRILDGRPREATITITPVAGGLLPGLHQGTLVVEALLPSGEVVRTSLTVVVDKSGVPRYEAGRPVS